MYLFAPGGVRVWGTRPGGEDLLVCLLQRGHQGANHLTGTRPLSILLSAASGLAGHRHEPAAMRRSPRLCKTPPYPSSSSAGASRDPNEA